MIRGVIFDFDGLILETETPIFQSWQELYTELGQELTLEQWSMNIGTADPFFDPLHDLQTRLGDEPDWNALLERRTQRELALVAALPAMPGVKVLLDQARATGLKTAIASSSPRDWVVSNLERIKLLDYFDCICTQDDVKHTKPDPELYCLALKQLGLQPQEALVLEDSPNGVLAARRAGIFCVAVPNLLTRDLPLQLANMRLDTLEGLELTVLLHQANAKM